MYLSEKEREIIRSLADCDMNITDAANKVFIHRNTFCYHMDKIKKKTGLNPKKFYDLIDLLKHVTQGEIENSSY